MDINQIVAFLAPLLPYLVKGGIELGKAAAGKLGEKITEDSWEGLKKLGGKIRKKAEKKPSAQEAIADLDASPKDEDAQAAVRQQLKKLLAENHELALEAGTVVGQIFDLSKSERSVVVGGNVEESVIITGDANRVTKPAPRRRQ
jgi:putative NADH-flavin reductase